MRRRTRNGGLQSSSALLQVLQKRPVSAATEALLELYYSCPAMGALVGNGYESTSSALFNRHLRHHRESCVSSYHGQNSRKLTAFEDYVEL